MPGLRELSLTGLPRGDELCDLLPALGTLPRLQTLCDHVLIDCQADPEFSPAGDCNELELIDDLSDDEMALDERAIHEALSRESD